MRIIFIDLLSETQRSTSLKYLLASVAGLSFLPSVDYSSFNDSWNRQQLQNTNTAFYQSAILLVKIIDEIPYMLFICSLFFLSRAR